jgi:hypothetical protein
MELTFRFLRLRKIAEVGEVTISVDEVTEEAIREKLENQDFKRFLTTDIETEEESWNFRPQVESPADVSLH